MQSLTAAQSVASASPRCARRAACARSAAAASLSRPALLQRLPLGAAAARCRRPGFSRRGVSPLAAAGDGKPDWDAAWKDFKKRSKFDPEQYVDRPATPPGWGGQARDDIRRTERNALAAWTSPTFAKAGILVVVLTLFVFIVVVGPPPSDGRCTLPWCG